MRRAGLLALLLVVPPGEPAGSAVARLAEKFADAIVAVAKGRPIELATPEDHTGRGAALALDLRELMAARLEGRLAQRDSGPRLRIVSAVSETPGRLVVSARVVEEPGGRLVDLVSASVEADQSPLGLTPEPPPAAGGTVDIVATDRTPPLPEPVLALAFLGEGRLAVLTPDAVALYRREAASLGLESRQAVPGPAAPVRAPAGLILASPEENSLWVLTNRAPRAALYGVEGSRLVRRRDAAALPWPGCPDGLRYQPGTNLIEGAPPGLGPGPVLTLAGAGPALAVMPDGRVRGAGGSVDPALRLGPTLAPILDGLVAASNAGPPGGRDALLLLAPQPDGLRVVDTIPVTGAIRALAAGTRGDTARLAAAVEEPGGATHLLLMDLRRRLP